MNIKKNISVLFPGKPYLSGGLEDWLEVVEKKLAAVKKDGAA